MLTEGTLFPNLGRLTPAEVASLTLQERALLRVMGGYLSHRDLLSMRGPVVRDSADEALLAVTQ